MNVNRIAFIKSWALGLTKYVSDVQIIIQRRRLL